MKTKETIELYRVVSETEKNDYDKTGQFRTSRNTLEAKQFFKTIEAIEEFIANATIRKYHPNYSYLMFIKVDKERFEQLPHDELILDGFDAVNIYEDYLHDFNDCITFVESKKI
jgi:hypothetical protein